MRHEQFGRGRRAVVVDDEPLLAELIGRILDEAGFTVMTLVSSVAATLVLQNMRRAPDLLVTDCLMPTITGPQLIGVARRRFPSLPILLTTGLGRRDPSLPHLPRDIGTLPKPFTIDDLLRCARDAVAGVLARPRRSTRSPGQTEPRVR